MYYSFNVPGFFANVVEDFCICICDDAIHSYPCLNFFFYFLCLVWVLGQCRALINCWKEFPLLFAERDCANTVLFPLWWNSPVKSSLSEFNSVNTSGSLLVQFILSEFQQLVVLKELVCFIYIGELICVQLFVVCHYYPIDVCRVYSDTPAFTTHIGNISLLSLSLNNFARDLSILLFFYKYFVFIDLCL